MHHVVAHHHQQRVTAPPKASLSRRATHVPSPESWEKIDGVLRVGGDPKTDDEYLNSGHAYSTSSEVLDLQDFLCVSWRRIGVVSNCDT
jgi:hypothetical protein